MTSRPRGEPWRARALECEVLFQAQAVGVATLGADEVPAYKAQIH